jgi:hypothetical protein
MSGLEVAAVFGASKMVAAWVQLLGAASGLPAEVARLQRRLLAVASAVSSPDGEADSLENDVRLAPLRALLEEATGWVERRRAKFDEQWALHKVAMATWT